MSYFQRIDEAVSLLGLRDWLEGLGETKDGGGGELRLETCPACTNSDFKLYVNTQIHRWICYVCDYGRGTSDVTQLMSAVSGRSLTSIRSELLALVPPAPKGDLTEPLIEAFSEGVKSPVFDAEQIDLPGSPFNGPSLSGAATALYARSRGLSQLVLSACKFRYAASLPVLGTDKTIQGPFLITPVCLGGRPVSYQGRRINNNEPRYVSGPVISNWLWPLDGTLLNTYSGDQLFLVEGVFDALGFLAMGYSAVCTFGKSLSDAQIELITELSPNELVFAWDLDARKEILRAIDRISFKFPTISVLSLSGYPDKPKVDGGDALMDKSVFNWIKNKINSRMNTNSPEFFKWRL